MHETDNSQYQDEIDLVALGILLWKKKWMILFTIVICIVGALAINMTTTPIYESTAYLKIQDPLFRHTYIPAPPSTEEIAKTFKSPSVLQTIHELTGLGESWESLDSDLSIEVSTQTQLIILKAQAKSTEDATRLLDVWMKTVVEDFNQKASDRILKTYNDLTKQLDEAKQALREVRREWTDFLRVSENNALTKRLDSLTSSLVQYESRSRDLNISISAVKAKIQSLGKDLEHQQSSITLRLSLLDSQLLTDLPTTNRPDVLESETLNPIYQNVTQELIDLRAELADLESRLMDTEQLITQTHTLIIETQSALANENEKREELRIRLEEQTNRYTALLQQYEQARIVASMLPLDYFTIISQPLALNEPVKPRTLLNIAITAILGIFAGIGLALISEYIDSYYKSRTMNITG